MSQRSAKALGDPGGRRHIGAVWSGPRRGPSPDALDLISISLAAAALHMAQPSASARLRRFEAIVGTALLDRRSQGSRLTPAGRLIAGWAGEVVSALDGMSAAIGSLSHGRANPLLVAASLTIAEHLLLTWLAALSERLPAADVYSFVGNSAAVCARVASGEAALGFIESPDAPASLTTRTFASDEVVPVAGRSHPWS